MAVNGLTWLNMAENGWTLLVHGWKYLEMPGIDWTWLEMDGNCWEMLEIAGNGWKCREMAKHGWN